MERNTNHILEKQYFAAVKQADQLALKIQKDKSDCEYSKRQAEELNRSTTDIKKQL